MLIKLSNIENHIHQQYKPRKIWLIADSVLFIAALTIFCYLIHLVMNGKNLLIDTKATQLLKPFISSSTTNLMVNISFFGSSYFLVPAYTLLIAYCLFIAKKIYEGISILIVGLLGDQLWLLMQHVVHRHRPYDPLVTGNYSFGFPSGHAFSSCTFYMILIWIIFQTGLHKRFKIIIAVLLLLLVIAIGTSRIYLHVHYASDVVGGYCLSIMWLLIAYTLFNLIKSKRSKIQ